MVPLGATGALEVPGGSAAVFFLSSFVFFSRHGDQVATEGEGKSREHTTGEGKPIIEGNGRTKKNK